MVRSTVLFAAAVAGVLFVQPADAAPIPVGTGPATAAVVLNFPDGFIVDYSVAYGSTAGSTITPADALAAADAADTRLSTVLSNFGTAANPNVFLNVATYTGGHTGDGATYNGTSAPENYWHEYFDNGAGYVFGNGLSNDTLVNGGTLGLVFGSANLPAVPEPATVGLATAAIAVGTLGRRRRCRLAR